MAPPAGTLRVGRYFLSLLILFVVLFAIVFWPGTDHAPKLGLDLRGGAQIIYKAQTTSGKTPSRDSMNQAKSIIDQRVNGLGVEQSTVVIQGSDEIVVTVPGKRSDEIANVGKTALLNFRPLISGGYAATTATASSSASASAGASTSSTPTAGATPSGTAAPASSSSSGVSGQNAAARPLAADTTPASASVSPSASATPSAAASASPSASAGASPSASATGTAAAPSLDTTALGYAALTDAQKTEINNYQCTQPVVADADKDVVVCDAGHTLKYLLGPILVPGTEVNTASAQAPNASSGNFAWTVLIELKSSGQKTWSEYTSQHHNADSSGQSQDTVAANYVAFTLDDEVISTPTDILGTINGNTQVTGNFTQTQANDLANSLKYGALPLKFTPEQSSTVSATLGSAQLKAGLLAGGIGLILVVIYSLLYYRALGLVTIASLLVSGGLTYASLVILGSQIGFTLTLAGIAGFIVAVGITADSFVVLFERIKDEVHEGRTMRVAVPRAWIRARRTIISADIVSFLAAAVLYVFAAGDVRGFAFTLGMSTILDLVVVYLFTHPLVSLLSRSAAFGSARFTGLNSARSGGIAQSATTAEDRRRAVAAKRAAGRSARSAGDTLVLEGDDDSLDLGVDDSDDDVDDVESPVLDVIDESVIDGADSADDADGADGAEVAAPRARTEPVAGTAAERAAARRARLREEGGKN